MLPHRFPHQRSDFSDFLERGMERIVVRWADRVVTTTDRMRNAMLARYPSLPPEKFVCIPNSIDTDGIRSTQGVEPFEKLTITYAGTLYFDRTPEPLFRAVADVIATGRGSVNDIRIVLLGDCRKINGRDTEIVVREYGLDEVVQVIDRVPYPQAVEMMRKSHLLLVLAPQGHELVVPAKIYDYLGTGSVVITLAEPGATADLMHETQCGRCFSHADIAGMRDYIAGLLEDRSYRHLRNSPEMFARYDARELTTRLVSEITRVEAGARSEVVVGASQ
jgi:glycosyltransferase involved in cell wall biosynthesis